ncbi:MAG TPA: hypothetical protein VFZ97_05995 [Acidimicrobiales bacterium]
MRIPSELQGTAKKYALKKWVDSNKFPCEKVFQCIDGVQPILRQLRPEGDNDELTDAEIAGATAKLMLAVGSITQHVLSGQATPESTEEWELVYLTVAYYAMARQERERKNG